MPSKWRIIKASMKGTNQRKEVTVPTHFRCPISLDLMKDPVILSTGITYDRENIEAWIDDGNRICPVTKQEMKTPDLIPNHVLRRRIQDWCVENRHSGIERIPTPRIPLSSTNASKLLLDIVGSSRIGNYNRCRELLKQFNLLRRESDRNLKCLVSNGACRAFSEAFDAASSSSSENCNGLLEEILSSLTWTYPIDQESRNYLGTKASLSCLLRFLKYGDLAGRRNSVLALTELVSSNQQVLNAFQESEGSIESLVELIKEPISLTTTKASLIVIYCLVSPTSPVNEKIAQKIVEMGMISLLLDILFDSDRSTCEKGLAVFDSLCNTNEGRQKAHDHPLTMPVLVKKIFRVSDIATELSISSLWKLCMDYTENDGLFLIEGLQVGVFQKLLLSLQVGCSERTKEQATNLLKLMNSYRRRLGCVDSLDFKQLKRPV